MKRVIFSLSQNLTTASSLASALDGELGKVFFDSFADGEILVKSLTDVKDKEVIVVESTAKGAQEKIFELLLLLDSIKRAGAKKIKLFIPYFGYSRQERVSWINEPVSCEVVAKIIETAQYDELYTLDLHHPIIESFFKKGIKSLSSAGVFAKYYMDYFKEHSIEKKDVVIVAPDHGSNQRVTDVAKELKCEKIILDKVRKSPNVSEHLQIVNGDVKDKTCILVDDMIDTGGTIVSAAKLLYSKGAKSVMVCATHGVFSKGCFYNLRKANIMDIVITNSIEQLLPKDVHQLSILPIITKVL